jgi:streptomycin 6-kinase
MKIPNSFFETVLNLIPHHGEKWIDELPTTLHHLVTHWNLSHLEVVENLSHNLVMKGFQGNVPIILKLCIEKEYFTHEKEALLFYKGHGIVRLLSHHNGHQALLMEFIHPGTPLIANGSMEELKDVEIASAVMNQLHDHTLPSHHPFPTVEQWMNELNMEEDFHPTHIKNARIMAKELIKTQGEVVLLHGDLHHDNIVNSKKQGWVAIDPKGVVGERAFEAGCFIRNPFHGSFAHYPKLKPLISKRIELFAHHMKCSQNRIARWAYVQAVLAAVWRHEDKGDIAPFMYRADVILSILNEQF